MRLGFMIPGGFPFGEARNAEVIVITYPMRTMNPDLWVVSENFGDQP